MANLKELKNRIASVKNTRKITKAMQMVAAAKLRRAQEAAEQSRPYTTRFNAVMGGLAASVGGSGSAPKLLSGTGSDQVQLMVVMTSERGLCGGFNSNIVKKAKAHAAALKAAGKTVKILTVGKKGRDQMKREYGDFYIGHVDLTEYLKAQGIGENLSTLFSEKKVDKVFMVYNEFKSVMQQEVVVEQLLPVVPEKLANKDDTFAVDYIYEPDEESILDELLKRYMTVEVYRAFLESSASEHGARMTAMDSASRNAGEMIDGLTLTYNKARQAYITKELIEIVNGAEALKG